MKDTSFAFADSQLRALEPTLLTKAQLDGLISAENEADVTEQLVSFGWNAADDADSFVAKAQNDLWETVYEHVNGTVLERFLTCRNDFHNLKVAVKSLVSAQKPMGYVYPTLLSCDGLAEALGKKEYECLPLFLQTPAKDAYAVATLSGDGQQIDTLLDKCALIELQKIANESENGFIKEYCEALCVQADIKIALRAIRAQKSNGFLEDALVDTKAISVLQLIAAAGSEESFLTYIEQIGFAEYKDAITKSLSQFEKLCDDSLMDIVKATRLKAFGPEQILAYYFAKENEIRNVRIILACKASGADSSAVIERMRELYV